ncbi:MAG: AAA family ATPase [Pirellulaceae bacterium]|nr:AAA family ATPase [Pirellulaceae bacterium]
MYTAYWKLNARPFDNGCDPQFYYPSESHQVTLLKLRYALDHPRGAALLAGAAGLGKSLLAQTLLADLPESFGPLIHLKFPQMSPPQLLALIAEELTGRNMDGATADRSVLAIQRTLSKNQQEGRRAVIVIDEAHLLHDTDALETLRLLMNFAPAWTLVLVAQPSLLPVLERTPELEERIGVQCLLRPLPAEESVRYISHRMSAAGAADVDSIFDPAALDVMHQLSGGIPSRINRLGDLALLIGFAEEQQRVTADHVAAVADELLTAPTNLRHAA